MLVVANLAFYLLAALGFGFVIFIHELGHFLIAKWAGVKVEVFSIGFGPKLLSRQIGETEYTLSLLPFGGYVKMLGQDDNPNGEQPKPGDPIDPRSFLAASAGWKAFILLGGVLFNLISSYIILLTLALTGMPVFPPAVGSVQPQLRAQDGTKDFSPADRLGLRQGDRILTMNGTTVRSFEDIITETIIESQHPVIMTVARRGEPAPLTLPPGARDEVKPIYSQITGHAELGIGWPDGDHVAQVISASKDAAAPEPGERVVGIVGEEPWPSDPPLIGQEIHARLLPYLGRHVTLMLEKGGASRTVDIVYAGDGPSAIGFPTVVSEVLPGMPAEEAGVKAGDILLAIDDQPISDRSQPVPYIHADIDHGKECRLRVWRASSEVVTGVETDPGQIVEMTMHGKLDGAQQRIGVRLEAMLSGRMPVLPALQGGGQTPLMTAGVVAGDTVVALLPTDKDKGRESAAVAVLAAGERILVPIPKSANELGEKTETAPQWAHWLGGTDKKSVFEQLIGAKVKAIDGKDAAAPGGVAPGIITLVRPEAKSPLYVDVRKFAELAPEFLAQVRVGDWIVARVYSPQGTALEILRGVDGDPQMKPYEPGVAFTFDREEVPYKLSGTGEAFTIVNTTSYNMVVKTFQLIPRFFRSAEQGGINPNKSLSGPIGIFSQLKVRAQHFGLRSYLKFLALIGLNLFLVNLLPIPITDGGQLVFLGIETAIGRPLPPLVRNGFQWAGVILVVGLMVYVLGLDITRLLPG